ncbi:hypothetical protein [Geosporobacter ferrireducens]|uniref:Lipoprotein n=1 Tax=Geosporobacter ferrireducens TaxID=1424294 RepID=A0A1D8GP31_9FIRM|nr:hypothetical protein [Geosporobacter ferrireducens]AOT72627.1 hypothetical protein Gferi_25575 [Geosporobacter ferrireducens]MTI55029.1 hypothetical protein [Geosporobacter ferrireducens]
MKKLKTLFLLLSLSTAILSCKPEVENNTPQIPIEQGMEQTDFQKAESPEGLNRTFFIVEEINAEEFLDSYERTLHSEGWVTTDSNKPVSITVTKDSRILIVVAKPIAGTDRFEVVIFSN